MTYTKALSFPRTFRPFTDVMGRFLIDTDPFNGGSTLRRTLPRVNILEDEKTYKLEILVPGYAKDELKLNLEQDVLSISAELGANEVDGDQRFTRREFSVHAFSRSFHLPELVDGEAISAEHKNGVLTVNIPKKTEAKPVPKPISIG